MLMSKLEYKVEFDEDDDTIIIDEGQSYSCTHVVGN
jgi:hypothetical protein